MIDGKLMLARMFRSKGTPFWDNVANMVEHGDMNGLEQTARNLCKSNNMNPDDAMNRAKGMFGQHK